MADPDIFKELLTQQRYSHEALSEIKDSVAEKPSREEFQAHEKLDNDRFEKIVNKLDRLTRVMFYMLGVIGAKEIAAWLIK